jgi:hypothetical protein
MRCAICQHPKRAKIEGELLSGTSFRDIAGRFAVSKSSVGRHRQHLPASLVKARDIAEVAQADSLLARVVDLHERATGILGAAECDGLPEVALKAIREARACVELMARIEGAIRDTQVNVVQIELDAGTATRMAETYLARRRGEGS